MVRRVILVSLAVVASLGLESCRGAVNAPRGAVNAPQHGPVPMHDATVTIIEGRLEDSETDRGHAGEIRAYVKEPEGYVLLDRADTDGGGNFALSFGSFSQFIWIKARLKDGAADASYVRTIVLPNESRSDLVVRAVPYTGLNGTTVETAISVEQFREFIVEITGVGIYPWRESHPIGVEVLHEFAPPRPFPWAAPGSFSQDEMVRLERILSDDGVMTLFGGRDVHIQFDDASTPDSAKHYHYGFDRLLPDEGWIIIYPAGVRRNMPLGNGFPVYSAGGYSIGGHVILRISGTGISDDYLTFLVSHELGHVIYAARGVWPHHTRTLTISQSIMSHIGPIGRVSECLTPCLADRKAIAIAYEETFPGRTQVEDILGYRWP